MQPDQSVNRGAQVLPRRRDRRNTKRARRRRINELIKRLAIDASLDLMNVTLAQRGMLAQAASLMFQIETRQDQLVGGGVVDADRYADRSIRLSSELRRLTNRLRECAAEDHPAKATASPWSPLRSRIANTEAAQ
jgi:DnaJ-domain-containing protein 1